MHVAHLESGKAVRHRERHFPQPVFSQHQLRQARRQSFHGLGAAEPVPSRRNVCQGGEGAEVGENLQREAGGEGEGDGGVRARIKMQFKDKFVPLVLI